MNFSSTKFCFFFKEIFTPTFFGYMDHVEQFLKLTHDPDHTDVLVQTHEDTRSAMKTNSKQIHHSIAYMGLKQ